MGEGLKELIQGAVEEDYILELKAKHVGYMQVSVKDMITHLRERWGSADFVDKCALINELNTPWSVAELLTVYFNRIEKAIKQLARCQVLWPKEACMNSTLKAFKDTRDYDIAIREWEAKPEASKTWDNLKVMVTTEYARFHKHNSSTAKSVGYSTANNVEEYAALTEEIVANITEEHSKEMKVQMQHMESLAKSMMDLVATLKAQPKGNGSMEAQIDAT